MKVTNRTAYATIGCDVQLSESDRLALGIELDKIINWLEKKSTNPKDAEECWKAIHNLTVFVSKFAIRPSKTNVFTDSPEDYKKADETTTTVEPASAEDNVITVDIVNAKKINLITLAKIINHATDASPMNISDLFNSAKETNVPYITFRCTRESKEEVVSKLMNAGFKIEQNNNPSFSLESYMTKLNDHK